MLVRALRARPPPCAWRGPCRVLRVRQYNASPATPPKTYFQPPPQPPKPPRRIFRTVLWSSACFTFGVLTCAWLILPLDVSLTADVGDRTPEELQEILLDGGSDNLTRIAPPLTLQEANQLLAARGTYSVAMNSVGHACQVPSNSPCEDTYSSGHYALYNDFKRDWCEWSIFDGHAGPRTSDALQYALSSHVGSELWKAKCMDRPYVPNDPHIINTIKKAFLDIDGEILGPAARSIMSDSASRTDAISLGAPAFSGSCALMALYDPVKSILRVANVGDSRAVLGRWDAQAQKYVVKPLSIDQKGFNPDELARINREHPGEDVVDPRSGRVHGIAVTRAFGDARWKWPADLSQRAHEYFWGPTPRPAGLIKTPPYLTAEPDVMESRIQTTGAHPDFLIMGSDGLWDVMSSEHAVECVQMWLAKFKPDDFVARLSAPNGVIGVDPVSPPPQSPNNPADDTYSTAENDDEETYYDDVERARQWRVSPKHFIVEDGNCGVHLIKNALGGNRRGLFTSVLSVQPPLSRNMRDDITVQVIFFGIKTEPFVHH